MEQIERRFANEIAAKLSGAPESDAKAEMIEELAENLTSRYNEMTAGGMAGEEAFARAMEELGDTAELTAYLNSLEPDGDASAAGTPGGDMDELLQAIGDIGRTVGDIAKQAAGAAGDFFRSDSFKNSVRSAAREGKRAAREAQELLRGVAGATVHVHVDGDGKAADFGWGESGDDEQKSIPSQGLRGLDVETTGDVDLHLDEDPQAPVRVEGDMSRLDVSVTEDGVLQVRPLFTASIQFFTFRGVSRQDVALTIPARAWESIRIATNCGDVDLSDELEADSLTVHTHNGDIACRVKSCRQAELKTDSGDVQLAGNAAALCVETVSGDVSLDGPMGQTEITTTSGDVALAGSVWKARVKSMSGDIRLESMTLPEAMDLASKSGDIQARIPDNGPFKVHVSSTSGSVDLRPFAKWSWSGDADPNAPTPRYTLTSISGDVSLDKY